VEEMNKMQIDTCLQDKEEERYGYGWQCWRTRAGWALYGMGGQLAILCPDRQAVLSTIADTRLDPVGVQRIYDAFFEEIWSLIPAGGLIPGDQANLPLTLELPAAVLRDEAASGPAGEGWYDFPEDNPLSLKALRLSESTLTFIRDTGSASLPFAFGQAKEISWPGHPDVPALVSAGRTGDGMLRIRCFAIGNAPCGFDMLVCVRDGRITVQSRRSSDPLTNGYDGIASGVLRKGETA
jgi:hypothetical protein